MANISIATKSLYDDLNENIEDCKKDITKHGEMLDFQFKIIRVLHSNDKVFTTIMSDIINIERKHMREIKLLKSFLLLNLIILAAIFGVLMFIVLEVI
ncbi:MAG: hypothetical protein ACLSVX_04830 [Massilimicrobiota timonensis]